MRSLFCFYYPACLAFFQYKDLYLFLILENYHSLFVVQLPSRVKLIMTSCDSTPISSISSLVFTLLSFLKEDSDKLSVLSFKSNIKISFYATPPDASLKFLMSHHLCSIHGGFRREREVRTRWRGCFHQRRIVPGWKAHRTIWCVSEEGVEKQRLGRFCSCGRQPRQRHCSRMTCFRSLDTVMQAIESYMVFSLQVALKW